MAKVSEKLLLERDIHDLAAFKGRPLPRGVSHVEL
jgi:hypothetical protein